MTALRAATIAPARRLRLYDRGAIAPGYRADVVLVDSLEHFAVSTSISDGRIVVRDGETCWDVPTAPELDALRNSLNLAPVTAGAFRLETPIDSGTIDVRTIVSHTPGTTTETQTRPAPIENGLPVLADEEDVSLIAVLARGGGSRFVGLLRGLGLHAGAVATSHAHDSHNLAVIGRDRESMATAANAVIAAQGGIAVAVGTETRALLPLPIAGVVSPGPLPEVASGFRAIRGALHDLGVDHPHLLMRLSTYTLPVSTGLRITDRGLVDAASRAHVPLFPAEAPA
jgi:adenine deaminase